MQHLTYDFISFIKYLPQIISFVIFCGVIKFYIYYKLFNISFLAYVELTEILTLFMDNLLAFLIFLVTSLFFASYALINFYNKIIDIAFLYNCNFWDRCLVYSIVSINLLYVIIFSIIFSTIVYLLRKNIFLYEAFVIFIGLIFLCSLAPFLFIEFLLVAVNFFSFNDSVFIYVFFIFLIFSVFTAINEYVKIRYKLYFKNVTIYLDTETINCHQNFYYIGKLKSYMFFYDSIKKVCIVIPNSRVTKIIMDIYNKDSELSQIIKYFKLNEFSKLWYK